MIDTKWNQRFLTLAHLVAGWSKDCSTKVGAVIADDQRRIVSVGYNGFARGVDDNPGRYAQKSIKYEMVVHAEVNAILNANISTAGCTLYSTFFPCPRCAAVMIQAGIKQVVALPSPSDDRYREQRELAQTMFIEAGVIF